MMKKKITKEAVGLKYGFRSGLEDIIAKQLKASAIDPKYETVKLPYEVHKTCTYTPDFPLTNTIMIETKGRFLTADRVKMLLIKEQYPDIDFRFVFNNSKAKINKKSKTTYGMWCKKYGFKYADNVIPQEWIDEVKNEKSNTKV